MKRLISVLLCIAMVFSVAWMAVSCGENDSGLAGGTDPAIDSDAPEVLPTAAVAVAQMTEAMSAQKGFHIEAKLIFGSDGAETELLNATADIDLSGQSPKLCLRYAATKGEGTDAATVHYEMCYIDSFVYFGTDEKGGEMTYVKYPVNADLGQETLPTDFAELLGQLTELATVSEVNGKLVLNVQGEDVSARLNEYLPMLRTLLGTTYGELLETYLLPLFCEEGTTCEDAVQQLVDYLSANEVENLFALLDSQFGAETVNEVLVQVWQRLGLAEDGAEADAEQIRGALAEQYGEKTLLALLCGALVKAEVLTQEEADAMLLDPTALTNLLKDYLAKKPVDMLQGGAQLLQMLSYLTVTECAPYARLVLNADGTVSEVSLTAEIGAMMNVGGFAVSSDYKARAVFAFTYEDVTVTAPVTEQAE